MPIYEYVCEKCGDHIEVLQKITDKPPKKCQKCRGKLEKIVSRTAFQLKGSGWYKTDYASTSSSTGSDTGSEKKEKSTAKKDSAGSSSEGTSPSDSGSKAD